MLTPVNTPAVPNAIYAPQHVINVAIVDGELVYCLKSLTIQGAVTTTDAAGKRTWANAPFVGRTGDISFKFDKDNNIIGLPTDLDTPELKAALLQVCLHSEEAIGIINSVRKLV